MNFNLYKTKTPRLLHLSAIDILNLFVVIKFILIPLNFL